jgi:AraC-like DNA-binding protein
MDMIIRTNAGLASIASECGFSDQPHLTRAIVDLTGKTPGRWRKSNPFKTGQSEHE